MIKHWSVYRHSDGHFTGQQFSSTIEGHHELNIPDGCGAIEGRHDHLSKKIELETGPDGKAIARVTDWIPPSPSNDHAWDTGKRRWLLTPEAGARIQKKHSAQARIAQLESQQARRVRELLAANDPRLSAIDAEIQELRKDLDQGSTG